MDQQSLKRWLSAAKQVRAIVNRYPALRNMEDPIGLLQFMIFVEDALTDMLTESQEFDHETLVELVEQRLAATGHPMFNVALLVRLSIPLLTGEQHNGEDSVYEIDRVVAAELAAILTAQGSDRQPIDVARALIFNLSVYYDNDVFFDAVQADPVLKEFDLETLGLMSDATESLIDDGLDSLKLVLATETVPEPTETTILAHQTLTGWFTFVLGPLANPNLVAADLVWTPSGIALMVEHLGPGGWNQAASSTIPDAAASDWPTTDPLFGVPQFEAALIGLLTTPLVEFRDQSLADALFHDGVTTVECTRRDTANRRRGILGLTKTNRTRAHRVATWYRSAVRAGIAVRPRAILTGGVLGVNRYV